MSPKKSRISIIACQSASSFGSELIKEIDEKTTREVHLIDSVQTIFSNTELKTEINESIRGQDVFIVQDVENHTNGLSTDENLRALYTTVDACRRCDAMRITAILPSFPYARQDKQNGRDGITASRVAWELEGEMGVDHIITIELHNTAIQGFFRRAKIDNLRGSHVLLPYIKNDIKDIDNTVIIPTDLGGAKRANFYAQSLHTDIAFSYKERNYKKPNEVEKIKILGDVKDKDVYIIDDMIDTGGTLIKSIREVKENGAKSIKAVCTLAMLNGNAVENFSKLYKEKILNEIVGTNATYHSLELLKSIPWFKELSVTEYFAEIVYRVSKGKSIGELL